MDNVLWFLSRDRLKLFRRFCDVWEANGGGGHHGGISQKFSAGKHVIEFRTPNFPLQFKFLRSPGVGSRCLEGNRHAQRVTNEPKAAAIPGALLRKTVVQYMNRLTLSETPKRQRTAALQDASRSSARVRKSTRSWSAAV